LCLSEESFELKSGDRLVLYIDGLMDVTSLDRRRFELEGLVELLENFPDLSVEVLGHEIFNTLAECRGMNEQYDDMPLLIAEVLTPHHTNL